MFSPSEPRLMHEMVANHTAFVKYNPALTDSDATQNMHKNSRMPKKPIRPWTFWFYCRFSVRTTEVTIATDVAQNSMLHYIKKWRKRTCREQDFFHEYPHNIPSSFHENRSILFIYDRSLNNLFNIMHICTCFCGKQRQEEYKLSTEETFSPPWTRKVTFVTQNKPHSSMSIKLNYQKVKISQHFFQQHNYQRKGQMSQPSLSAFGARVSSE